MTQPTGGVPPRRPDQSYDPPPPAISPSSGDIVRAREVIIIGTGGLVLVYDPAAAAGDLIASIAGNATTDQYGNTVVQGIVSYDFFGAAPKGYTQINDGVITMNPGQSDPAVQISPDNDGNVLITTSNLLGAQQAFLYTAVANSEENIYHDFVLNSGWSVGTDSNGTSYPPAYQLMPTGEVAIQGCLVTPSSGTVLGTPFNSTALAAPYVPASGSPIPTATVAQATFGHGGTIEIHPNGNVELQGNFSTGENIRLDCRVRII